MRSVPALAIVVLALSATGTGCASRKAHDPLRDDVGVFCRAWDERGRPARISEMAKDLSSRIQSEELLGVFASIPPEGDPHLIAKLRAIVTRVGVTSCPTLDWMATKYPDAEDAAAPP